MINVNYIRLLLSEKHITNREIARAIGISEAGFYRIMRSKNCNCDTLIKLSEYFKIDITKFLEMEIAVNNDIEYKDLKYYEDLLKSKEEIINLLKDKLLLLNGKNDD